MKNDPSPSAPWEMEDEALAIILRHRPDLAGKTLKEVRAILRAAYPGKAEQRMRVPPASIAGKRRPLG